MTDATIRLGDVHDIKPAHGELHFRYAFPIRLATEGEMIADGIGDLGPIQLHMRVNDFEGGWRMDALAWVVPNQSARR